ncbi:MAG: SIMPL domain-containing protein [Elusimicrobia bacterium]|nr:SIMPL domain-containing protein [Elusimicrobiota bacterium]
MVKSVRKCIVCFFVFSGVFSFPVWATDKTEPRIITVTGDAEISVVPDEVILTIGVETKNENLDTAKSENDRSISNILAVTKKYKIKEKDVQTDHISINPIYKNQKFVNYQVRKTVVITLKDISLFEDLFSNILKNGANYVHGIQFRTTELRKYKDQARALAVKSAKEKAADLAREFGLKVGKPNKIQEFPSTGQSYSRGWGSQYWNRGMSNSYMDAGGYIPEIGNNIAIGQIVVNAMVSVEFELE